MSRIGPADSLLALRTHVSRLRPIIFQPTGSFSTVFLPFVVGIRRDRSIDEVSPVAPIIEQNALLKGLTLGRDHDDIVFARAPAKDSAQWSSRVCSFIASRRINSSVAH